MEDEITKQTNKPHKQLREKLKKRRENDKKAKKLKKEKKKKNDDKKKKAKSKHKKKDKADDEDDDKKLRKHLKKLRKLVADEIDDFIVLLENLDKGARIELEDIEQENVKKRLKKIFKVLKLRKNEVTKEYYKDPDAHSFSIQDKVESMVEEIEEQESSSSEEQDNELDKPDISKHEPEASKKHIQEEETLAELHAKLQRISETSANLMGKSKDETADKGVAEQSKDWKNFLDDKFSNVLEGEGEEYGKLRDKKKKVAPKSEEDKVRDDVAKQFINKYNETYRQKSLMEIHRENKATDKKKQKGMDSKRRPFDREVDLSAGRIDSKKLHEVLHEKKHSLPNRFSNAQGDRSFM